MINGIQSTGAVSFTRQLDALEQSGTNGLSPAQSPAAPTSDFGAVMSEMATNMVTEIQRGEQASMNGLNGEANTQEVVQAVMSAERTLQTALAVRDKIVTAYLEISRMAI